MGSSPHLGKASSSNSSASGGSRSTFGTDLEVSPSTHPYLASCQSMASDPDGNFYLAFQDDQGKSHIRIYWSNDGGEHWHQYGTINNPMADLTMPCIAIGAGDYHALLVTYIVDDGINMPVPEVALSSLHTETFTFHSVPVWTGWDSYSKPVIWTDASKKAGWTAYLTCQGMVNFKQNDMDICFWRSADQGRTWGDETVLFGDHDTKMWMDPDGSFGTSKQRLFVTCYNHDDRSLHCVASEDKAGPWKAPVTIHTWAVPPAHDVDPDVEAAITHDNVLICCTHADKGDDDIGATLSTDAGKLWSSVKSLGSCTQDDEFAPELTANEGGGSWHLAYTSEYRCFYTSAPQDMSSPFPQLPDRVDDAARVSHAYSKKGITSSWSSDTAGVCWTDYRDGIPDHDTYFDHLDDPDRIYVPEEYATIQDAIDAAVDGQIIHVNTGLYSQQLELRGKRIRLQSIFGPGSTVLTPGPGGTTGVLWIHEGEGRDTVVEGFAITGGYAFSMGGGIQIENASPTIRGNCIRNNRAHYGGGISCHFSGSPAILNNHILENRATVPTGIGKGGGILCNDNTAPLIMNNVIAGNISDGYGGGIVCDNCEALIVNNTVVNNQVEDYAGGICVMGPLLPLIKNVILWGNSSGWPYTHQIWMHTPAPQQVVHCNIEGGYSGGIDCINEAPLFVNNVAGDYRLTQHSPCINRGTDTDAPLADLDGYIRPCMGTTDIGAFEYTGTHSLSLDGFEIDLNAATQIHFELDGGAANAGRPYFILGSVSGTNPGLPLPGGLVTLPLNWDPITDLLISLANSPSLVDFHDKLNFKGRAVAKLDTLGPLPPTTAGAVLYFAYVLYEPNIFYPYDFVSNPVVITVVL